MRCSRQRTRLLTHTLHTCSTYVVLVTSLFFLPFLPFYLYPPLSPLLPSFIPTFLRPWLRSLGSAFQLARTEPDRQTIFGAFWAFGESSFSAVHEIFASAHKIQAFRWRKLGNGPGAKFLWVLSPEAPHGEGAYLNERHFFVRASYTDILLNLNCV